MEGKSLELGVAPQEPGSHASPAKGDLLPTFLLQVVEKGQVNTQQLPKPKKKSLEDFDVLGRERKATPGKTRGS